MVDPLEELIRQSTEFHAQMIADNNELDRAFQSGTFGKFVQSWGSDNAGGNELEGKAGSNVVEGENGGASGGAEAGEPTIQ
ncbi:MAG: hypothetical protein KDA77_09580 [Planctomycetaceae bacterium]|nr:hypothetical protein [Planctomycetaceae bacterium]